MTKKTAVLHSLPSPPGHGQTSNPSTYALPQAAHNVKGWRYFAGLFGGEHVAATEFVIGITFVTLGVGVADVLIGLLIGNALAVLSWRFLTAPIAVETRLSLYSYMQRIVGPFTTNIFNVINVVYYSAMSAAMITVSAYAVRFLTGIPVQLEWYPDSSAFVLVAILISIIVVLVASFGFQALADLSTIVAPWLLTSFLCGAFIALPALSLMQFGITNFPGWNGLVEAAGAFVWTGRTPEGEPGIGVWEVAGFAWASISMLNLGLIDMAMFRFAKRPAYGYFSAIGMFLGHYVAWIAAGLMGAGAALIVGGSLLELDAGDVAYHILGVTGTVIVVAAGWTTANACLYRAGLAAGSLFPSMSHSRVTIYVGIGVAIAACFPFVVSSVLPIMVYGAILLVPIGAIVATEHMLFPKIGLTRYWSAYREQYVNLPAIAAWGLSICFAAVLGLSGVISFYWLFLPQYIFASLIYTVFARFAGARKSYPSDQLLQLDREHKLSRFEAKREAAEAARAIVEVPRGSKALLVAAGCSLLAMIGTSVWVFLASGSEADYATKREIFHQLMIGFSLIYFAFVGIAMRRAAFSPAPEA